MKKLDKRYIGCLVRNAYWNEPNLGMIIGLLGDSYYDVEWYGENVSSWQNGGYLPDTLKLVRDEKD